TTNQLLQNALPNVAKSGLTQQFDQAKLNFATAVLRKESGAAISQTEYDNVNKQYFPQPGDSAETSAQKAANRATAVQALNNAAGNAGSIRVKQKSSGQTGNIPASEFDPNLYERI